MTQQYENIVIGSGVAGLICAGYLARDGQETLLLERNSMPGGRFEYIHFDGYTNLSQGPMWFPTWGGGWWPTIARELKANIRYLVQGPSGIYNLGSKKPVAKIACNMTAAAMVDQVKSTSPEPLTEDDEKEYMRFFEYLFDIPWKEFFEGGLEKITIGEWLVQNIPNEKVWQYIVAIAANMVEYTWQQAWDSLSAGIIFSMLRGWMGGEAFITLPVPDSYNGLIVPFAESFKNFGGKMRLSTPARKVIVENGKAVGVVAKPKGGTEERISAKRVVIAAPYWFIPSLFDDIPETLAETCRLMDEKTFVGDYWLYAGLNKPLVKDLGYIMVNDPKTGDYMGGSWATSNEMPWMAPEGKQLIQYLQIFDREEMKTKDPEEIKRNMCEILEEMYPGFNEAIESWKLVKHAPLYHQQFSIYKIPCKSPDIENLYFTGDSTAPHWGFGAGGAMSTGGFCAQAILGYDKVKAMQI